MMIFGGCVCGGGVEEGVIKSGFVKHFVFCNFFLHLMYAEWGSLIQCMLNGGGGIFDPMHAEWGGGGGL